MSRMARMAPEGPHRGECRHQEDPADLARHTRSLGRAPAPFPVPTPWHGRARVSGMPSRSLVVKVTAGKDDPERCNQAFTVAATAVAAGLEVSLWLTGEAAWFALPGRADDVRLPYARTARGSARQHSRGRGTGNAVAPSAPSRREIITEDDVITGIRIGGSCHPSSGKSLPTGRRRWCTGPGRSRSAGHCGEPLLA